MPVRATPGESRAGAADWGTGCGQKEEGSSKRLSQSGEGGDGPGTTKAGGWGGEPGKPRGPLTSRRKGRE